MEPQSVEEMDPKDRDMLAMSFNLLFNSLPPQHQRLLHTFGARHGLDGVNGLAKLLDEAMHVERMKQVMAGL